MTKIRVLFYLAVVFVTIVQCQEVTYKISESAQKNFPIGQILSDSRLITEYDASIVSVLQYSLVSRGSLPTDYFKINNQTSELSIKKPIDRDSLCDLLSICCDAQCVMKLSVAVQPTSGKFFIRTVKIRIEVADENDNNPKFQSKEIQGHISESATIGSTVSLPTNGNLLLASDRDFGKYGIKNYTIISPTGTFGLRVEQDFGSITDVSIVSLKKLDRENIGEYKVAVVVKDGGRPPRSDTATVTIKIDDANDHIPKFSNETYSVWVSEDIPINTSVITVHATDLDSGENGKIEYSIRNHPNNIVSRRFRINRHTGEIQTKGRLNFEDYPTYHIIVQAADQGTAIQKKSRSRVTVHLRDVNDHSPIISFSYLTKSQRAEVSEAAPVDTFIAFIIVSDPDNDAVNCQIDNPMFRLREKGENEYHLVTAYKLNRELQDEYSVTITCSDEGKPSLRTAETFDVYVLDSNDHQPKFTQSTYTASVVENNDRGVFLLQVRALDDDAGENARVIYSLSDQGKKNFTIEPNSGKIYANTVFDREEYDQIQFKILARDNGTEPQYAEANVVLRVVDENDNRPSFHPPLEFEISEAAGAGVMVGQMSATDPDVGRNKQIQFELQYSHDAQSFDISKSGIISTRVELDREKKSHYEIVVIAKDNGTVTNTLERKILSSSATIVIKVLDINDNPPIIDFPSSYNNTVWISYLEPVGHTIIHVNASDMDAGKNAFLDYSFSQGNKDVMFKINQNTGAIQVAKKMQPKDAVVYKLGIRVEDRAEPYNSNVEILNIVVDGTGKAISLFTGSYLDSISSNRNLIIVICLAAVSGILAIILIVAIVCIRKKDNETHRYSVKTETQRIYDKRPSICSDGEVKSPPIRKEVSFSMEADHSPIHNGGPNTTYSTLKHQPSWNSSINPKSLESARQGFYDRGGSGGIAGSGAPSGGAVIDTSDSDVSHADSGRGASDDDMNAKSAHPYNNGDNTRKNPEGAPSRKRVADPSRDRLNSPSSPPPAYNLLTGEPKTPTNPRNYLDTIGTYSSFKAPKAKGTDASPSKIYASLQRSRKYSGASQSEPYSCADMDSVLENNYKSPRLTDPYRTKDELRASPSQNVQNVSSGSQASSRVDAEELCNQIDHLFFRDVYV